jgi:hypothetical protein
MANNNPHAIEEMAIKKLQLLSLWSTPRKAHCNKGERAAKQQELEGQTLLKQKRRGH